MKWELKKYLYERGIQQRDIAKAIGVSQTTISYIIRGKLNASKRILKLLAEYLSISEEELLGLMEK